MNTTAEAITHLDLAPMQLLLGDLDEQHRSLSDDFHESLAGLLAYESHLDSLAQELNSAKQTLTLEKDALNEREARLGQARESVRHEEAELARREEEFHKREANLARREVDASAHDEQLSRRQHDLTERERLLNDRERLLTEREQSLGKQNRSDATAAAIASFAGQANAAANAATGIVEATAPPEQGVSPPPATAIPADPLVNSLAAQFDKLKRQQRSRQK